MLVPRPPARWAALGPGGQYQTAPGPRQPPAATRLTSDVFTGLIQAVGRVTLAERSEAGLRLAVDTTGWDHTPARGDSIAVSGVCLTVAAEPEGSALTFDAVPQTLAITTLGSIAAGDRVNLEHAARADTLMGGHVVQGHADGTAEVDRVTTPDPDPAGEWRVGFRLPRQLARYFTPKGSVAVDGVSLTIAALETGDAPRFEVALIPETLERTTLAERKPGDRVNIEADPMAKTLVHWLEHHAPAMLKN